MAVLSNSSVPCAQNPVYHELDSTTGDLKRKNFFALIFHGIFYNLSRIFCLGNRYHNNYLKKLTAKVITNLNNQNSIPDKNYLKTASAVLQLWEKKVPRNKKTPIALKTHFSNLQRSKLGLEYRIEYIQKQLPPAEESDVKIAIEDTSEMLIELLTKAGTWKESEVSFASFKSDLTAFELTAIKELCNNYPKMANALLKNADIQEAFFRWVIQEGNSVETFVLFPSVQQMISKHNFSGCVGRIRNSGISALQVGLKNSEETGKAVEIDITLPFMLLKDEATAKAGEISLKPERGSWETRRFSILNLKSTIPGYGFGEKTLKQIFEVFRNKIKTEEIGNFEWSPIQFLATEESGGIFPFNSWDHSINEIKISTTKPDWFTKLPVDEHITFEEAQERYKVDGKLKDTHGNERGLLERGKPIFSARAALRPHTKNDAKLEKRIAPAHGYMELALPRKDGSYSVYSLGKFAPAPGTNFKKANFLPDFVRGILVGIANLGFIGNTVHATYSTNDENRYKFHRRHYAYSFCATKDELLQVFKMHGEKIQASFNKTDPTKPAEFFSYGDANCSQYIGKDTLVEVFGLDFDPYTVNLRDVRFPSPIKYFMHEKTLPKNQKWYAVKLLRAGRGKEVVIDGETIFISVENGIDWEKPTLDMPAGLPSAVDQRTGSLVDKSLYSNEEKSKERIDEKRGSPNASASLTNPDSDEDNDRTGSGLGLGLGLDIPR